MRRRVAALLWGLSLAAGASAEGTLGRNRWQDREPAARAVRSVSIVVGFGVEERRYIVDWFHDSQNIKACPQVSPRRGTCPRGYSGNWRRTGNSPNWKQVAAIAGNSQANAAEACRR
jgi:hypothetical protein